MDRRAHLCMDGGRFGFVWLPSVGYLLRGARSAGSMSAAMTAQLVTDALVIAIWRRGKPDALLHHSDRGSQYTSEQFQKADGRSRCRLLNEPLRQRLGQRCDGELLLLDEDRAHSAQNLSDTPDRAKADVFDYVECFYNPKRRHSTIGYLTSRESSKCQAGIRLGGCQPNRVQATCHRPALGLSLP